MHLNVVENQLLSNRPTRLVVGRPIRNSDAGVLALGPEQIPVIGQPGLVLVHGHKGNVGENDGERLVGEQVDVVQLDTRRRFLALGDCSFLTVWDRNNMPKNATKNGAASTCEESITGCQG